VALRIGELVPPAYDKSLDRSKLLSPPEESVYRVLAGFRNVACRVFDGLENGANCRKGRVTPSNRRKLVPRVASGKKGDCVLVAGAVLRILAPPLPSSSVCGLVAIQPRWALGVTGELVRSPSSLASAGAGQKFHSGVTGSTAQPLSQSVRVGGSEQTNRTRHSGGHNYP
jgi:hypothetical protein